MSAAEQPVVTAIAGPLQVGLRSVPMATPDAILARHNGKTYVVWDGHRSEIDVANKSVALALGIDSTTPHAGADVHRAVRRDSGHRPAGHPGHPERRRAVAVEPGRAAR